MRFRAPRGTRDLLPATAGRFQQLERLAENLFEDYGYKLIVTPTFEQTELFVRGIGEATDIVQKEMYTFSDRRGRSLTLRPEGTAPVVRAYLEHNLDKGSQPVKLYYSCAMYRYERPQAGRYREFWQLGVEALGTMDPAIDAEVVYLAYEYLRRAGVGKQVVLINSMGCRACRPSFTKDLKKHVDSNREQFCADCQRRLKTNPLRVFDCQNSTCQLLLDKAPVIVDYLCAECVTHFAAVKKYLSDVVPVTLSPRLVRGFDYYTKTTFEIQSPLLGAQNALGGGGRYDYLVEEYGGPATPAIGFALGVERILLALKTEDALPEPKGKPAVFLAMLGEETRHEGIKLLFRIRDIGVYAETTYDQKSIKAQLRMADKLEVAYAVILGSRELDKGNLVVRDMSSGDQVEIKLKEAPAWLGERVHNEETS